MADTSPKDSVDAESVVRKAIALDNRRIETVRELANAASDLRATEALLEEQKRVYAAAYKTAQRDGRWTDTELARDLALPKPDAVPRRRSTKKAASTGADRDGGEQAQGGQSQG